MSVPEVSTQILKFENIWKVVPMPCGDDVLVLVEFFDCDLLQVYNRNKLVASFQDTCLDPTQLQLKQTLVPHTFFPKLDGYAVNASPFMQRL
jgi:hypothetical protein